MTITFNEQALIDRVQSLADALRGMAEEALEKTTDSEYGDFERAGAEGEADAYVSSAGLLESVLYEHLGNHELFSDEEILGGGFGEDESESF